MIRTFTRSDWETIAGRYSSKEIIEFLDDQSHKLFKVRKNIEDEYNRGNTDAYYELPHILTDMIYKNMIDLAIPSVDEVVKVGDTIADIKEGVNAKVWSVGLITGSNEMGLTREEYDSRPAAYWEPLKREVRGRMQEAGAHFVLDSIAELPACIEEINRIMNMAK